MIELLRGGGSLAGRPGQLDRGAGPDHPHAGPHLDIGAVGDARRGPRRARWRSSSPTTGRAGWSPVSLVNLGRAIPSSAGGARLPVSPPSGLGLGFWPTLVALVALAMPPIFTNAHTGVGQVDPATVEAARGIGMSERQVLLGVEVPLAMPVIWTAIRVSAVAGGGHGDPRRPRRLRRAGAVRDRRVRPGGRRPDLHRRGRPSPSSPSSPICSSRWVRGGSCRRGLGQGPDPSSRPRRRSERSTPARRHGRRPAVTGCPVTWRRHLPPARLLRKENPCGAASAMVSLGRPWCWPSWPPPAGRDDGADDVRRRRRHDRGPDHQHRRPGLRRERHPRRDLQPGAGRRRVHHRGAEPRRVPRPGDGGLRRRRDQLRSRVRRIDARVPQRLRRRGERRCRRDHRAAPGPARRDRAAGARGVRRHRHQRLRRHPRDLRGVRDHLAQRPGRERRRPDPRAGRPTARPTPSASPGSRTSTGWTSAPTSRRSTPAR